MIYFKTCGYIIYKAYGPNVRGTIGGTNDCLSLTCTDSCTKSVHRGEITRNLKGFTHAKKLSSVMFSQS